jgi:peptidoglycan hydrolase-like protein with peptidoglycan-binding domain
MNTRIKRAAALVLAVAALLTLYVPLGRAEAYTGTVNKDKVFFRMSANTDSGYYNKLDKGDKVTLLDIRGSFYKVKFGAFTGYIMQTFIDASSAARRALSGGETPTGTSKYANISTISGLGGAPRPSFMGASGDRVEKLQRALQIKGYYNGNLDGQYGNGTAAAVEKYQKAVKLTASGTANQATINRLFGITDETDGGNDPGMSGITRISQIYVPNTSAPGDSGKHVKALQQALKLKSYFKVGIDSNYGEKTKEAVEKYQRAVGLSADGVAGFSTIRKLFGKSAANYSLPTERLDWFKNGSSTIPKGASFTVKDISTGESFQARRWSGANHLDAEPLSESDTRTIKALSGGYSWARRAVLVKYNGHVYAASITTMPHGTSTITGNGFNGVFCIHFYKSKTHETNRVDATHQNAVARAMNASW